MTHLKPKEILNGTINSAAEKAQGSFRKLLILSILAGAFIALAGAGANMAGFYFLAEPETTGIGKMISGLIFPAGLMMVVLAGAELFTGNNLMITAVFAKRIRVRDMLRNWVIVYLGNLIGSLLIAYLVAKSGLLFSGDGLLGQVTLDIAASKVSLTFEQAFIRGILCNFLVCIAVWMASGASSTGGKAVSLYFPIWLFVAAGFEHSIANMFFIPVGIFSEGASQTLNWGGFIGNLLPVTLGNMVGGCLLAGGAYSLVFLEKEKKGTDASRLAG